MTFDDFYTNLISDEQWYEHTLMTEGKGKNFRKAAEFVYGQLLADVRIRNRDMSENRKHVYNKLATMKLDQVFPVLQQVEENKEDKNQEPPLVRGSEQYLKRIGEYLEALAKCEEPKRVAPVSAKERFEAENLRPKPESIREPTHEDKVKAAEEHLKKALISRTKMFREKYPDGTTKELQKYLKSWKHIDNPNNLK